ncbi:MAG: DUF4136 domain-containing protein [Pseudomonadales bacterium]|nr:DUF4136 domain-containing protein [Pseudomonadales bacterium]
MNALRLLSLLFLLAGCASQQDLRTGSLCTAPERVDQWRTFAWIGAPGDAPQESFITPETVERLEAALVDAVQLQGLQLAAPEAADLLLGYRLTTTEFADLRLDVANDWGCWGREGTMVEDPRTYTEAALAVEMLERSTGLIVWRGWATKEITASDRMDPAALARQAAEAVLSGWPG